MQYSAEIKIHDLQKAILKKLTLNPALRFNELIIEGLASEHMNYHLKRLMDHGLVEKDETSYQLSDLGKDYSNLLDDEVEVVEKQPKTSVLLWCVRKNNKTNETEHLLSRRLRQPYFGKVGRIRGKVTFGESLRGAAERELFEEAGLLAENFTLGRIYHKVRYRVDNIFVQDVLFYIFFVTGFHGTLVEKTMHQENFWLSEQTAKKRTDLDYYDSFKWSDRLEPQVPIRFEESIAIADGY